ncbi:MAG: hypothetical protein ACK5PZ_17460 [Pirellula sp.]|jgi:hypothetical protein
MLKPKIHAEPLMARVPQLGLRPAHCFTVDPTFLEVGRPALDRPLIAGISLEIREISMVCHPREKTA